MGKCLYGEFRGGALIALACVSWRRINPSPDTCPILIIWFVAKPPWAGQNKKQKVL